MSLVFSVQVYELIQQFVKLGNLEARFVLSKYTDKVVFDQEELLKIT